MKISPTFYNEAGELMAPHEADLNIAGSCSPGGHPSKDAGWYHRFKFEAATEAEREAKLRRYVREMHAVPNCMILTLEKYKVTIGSFVRYGVDSLYAIEAGDGQTPGYDPRWRMLKYIRP